MLTVGASYQQLHDFNITVIYLVAGKVDYLIRGLLLDFPSHPVPRLSATQFQLPHGLAQTPS